jgi:DNA polymerase/3'-5' exonuclease PolX
MDLQSANTIAQELLRTLAPCCERIEVAGSVRRRKAQVKDLEIVHISKTGFVQNGTLFPIEGALIDQGLAQLIERGVLEWDYATPRNGPKYKRLVHLDSGLVVELFAAQPSTWGYILALRTGPAEFNQMLVSPPWKGGIKPLDISFEDGSVYRHGQPLDVPDERTFFALFNLPVIDPAERGVEITLWR